MMIALEAIVAGSIPALGISNCDKLIIADNVTWRNSGDSDKKILY